MQIEENAMYDSFDEELQNKEVGSVFISDIFIPDIDLI